MDIFSHCGDIAIRKALLNSQSGPPAGFPGPALFVASFAFHGSAHNFGSRAAEFHRIAHGRSAGAIVPSDAEDAFILNHGRVKPKGSLELKPDHSTTYTLVVERNGLVEISGTWDDWH